MNTFKIAQSTQFNSIQMPNRIKPLIKLNKSMEKLLNLKHV